MTIEDLIKKLVAYRVEHGNVVLYSRKSDGSSSWNSPVKPIIKLENPWPKLKEPQHFITIDAGY